MNTDYYPFIFASRTLPTSNGLRVRYERIVWATPIEWYPERNSKFLSSFEEAILFLLEELDHNEPSIPLHIPTD